MPGRMKYRMKHPPQQNETKFKTEWGTYHEEMKFQLKQMPGKMKYCMKQLPRRMKQNLRENEVATTMK